MKQYRWIVGLCALCIVGASVYLSRSSLLREEPAGESDLGQAPAATTPPVVAKEPPSSRAKGGRLSTTGDAGVATLPARPDSNQVVARVRDLTITRRDLGVWSNLRDDQARLEKSLTRSLLVLEFRRRQYEIPDKVISDRLDAVIQTEFGGSRAAFESALTQQGYTVEQYQWGERAKIVSQVMRQQILREAKVEGRPGPEQEEALRHWSAQRQKETPMVFPASRP